MIRQVFHIEHHWEVVVYYNVDYSLFFIIEKDMDIMNVPRKTIDNIYNTMRAQKAKAVTLSSKEKHRSIILFNRHISYKDYLNSIVHEAEHLKQAILEEYNIEDSGETPAYLIGYIVSKLWNTFKYL